MSQKKKEKFNKTKKLKNELNNEIRELIEDTTKEIAGVGHDDGERRELNRRIKAFENIRNAINSGEAKSPNELQKIFDDGVYTVLQWRALRKENKTLEGYRKMIKKNLKKRRKIRKALNNLPPSGQDSIKKRLLENKQDIEKNILKNKALEQEQAGIIINLQKNLNEMVKEYNVSPREDFLATTSATSDDGFSSSEDESLSSSRTPATTRRTPIKATATTRRTPREPSPRARKETKRKQPEGPHPQAYKRPMFEKGNQYLGIIKTLKKSKKHGNKSQRNVQIPRLNLTKLSKPVPFKGPMKSEDIFTNKPPKPPKWPRHHKVAPPPPPDDGDIADVEDNDSDDNSSSSRVTRKKLPPLPSSTRFQRTRTIHIKPKKNLTITPIKKEKSKPESVAPGTMILVKPGPNSSSSGIKAVKRRRKKKKGGRKTRKRSK